MLNKEIFNPKSIVIIGASNDVRKPGGKILKNLVDGGFSGKIYTSNPKEEEVQGFKSYKHIEDLPMVELAIIAVAAKYIPNIAEVLTAQHDTKAFIVISAGFSEMGEEGTELENELVKIIDNAGASLIGPNGIGVVTPHYHGVFTLPIPKLDPKGCDFISGSGATACFIMEAGIPNGLTFANIFSVGNSAQNGVEDILEYMDVNFDPKKDSKVKLLYMERVDKPAKLLKHAASLIRKGCKIAAVKAGSSEAGSRAASSHTGALANPDVAVDALFRKAGIVRCAGREELITVASVFMHPQLTGKNIAIVTHAGGPAVMLTDALSKGGLEVPHIENEYSKLLLQELYAGSSVANPIDFLATGTAEHLDTILNYTDNKFDCIDGIVVIFGTPGLVEIYDVYDKLDARMEKAKKPIYPVLPSILTAQKEVVHFIAKNRINFPDEVKLGAALAKVFHTPKPVAELIEQPTVDTAKIRKVVDASENGYISPEAMQQLLDAAGINRAKEGTAKTVEAATVLATEIGFPLVMKVVGPVHKSDVGGVVLNVASVKEVIAQFNRMIVIPETTAILMQPMLSGMELFAGAKQEGNFGHLLLCGMGGIFVEVLKDINTGIAPIGLNHAEQMINSLKSVKLLDGVRGQKGVNKQMFAETLWRLSALLQAAPEIAEMDLNPLLGTPKSVTAVDARIRIEK